MEISKKIHFPYPVLNEYTDDYIGIDFFAGIDENIVKGTRYTTIKTIVKVENNELKKLIEDNKMKIILKIFCQSTKFRKIFEVGLGESEIKLDNKSVNKAVFTSAFIVANEDLEDYTNNQLNPDYSGMSFNLPRGSIIAIGSNQKFFIEKDIDDLTKVNSIVTISKNPSEKNKIIVDYSDDKIIIRVPEEAFRIYTTYSRYCPSIVNSMIIVPSLMYVLDEIAKDDSLAEIEDKRWFRVITKKFKELTQEEFNIDFLKAYGSFDILQKVFEYPINEGLIQIENKWSIGGAD